MPKAKKLKPTQNLLFQGETTSNISSGIMSADVNDNQFNSNFPEESYDSFFRLQIPFREISELN